MISEFLQNLDKMEVTKMRRILYILILLVFVSPLYAVTIYKWTDEKGAKHYSDEYDKVPPAYRDRVEIEKWDDTQKPGISSSPSLETPVQKSDEVKTDIYGQDATYWRGRVRPWKERLEEANANYARVQSKYTEKSEELLRRKYGSPTQYKSTIIELDRLKEEMARYQAEIAEATDMLTKISKEAEEAKADPDWVK
jgi:hypothetical protein